MADLDRLTSLLHRLHEDGRTREDLPLYLTESGYQTSPPDPTWDVSLADQARWLPEAEQIARRQPSLRSVSQFLVRDLPSGRGPSLRIRWRDYQSGLRFEDGRAKPARASFALGLVAHRASPGRVAFWGLVRPGAGRRAVRIAVREPDGRWRTIGRARTGLDGTVAMTIAIDPARTFRLESEGAPAPRSPARADRRRPSALALRDYDDNTFRFSGGLAPNRSPVAEDQSLTAAQGGSLALTLSATDEDGDTLTYAVADAPEHGALTRHGQRADVHARRRLQRAGHVRLHGERRHERARRGAHHDRGHAGACRRAGPAGRPYRRVPRRRGSRRLPRGRADARQRAPDRQPRAPDRPGGAHARPGAGDDRRGRADGRADGHRRRRQLQGPRRAARPARRARAALPGAHRRAEIAQPAPDAPLGHDERGAARRPDRHPRARRARRQAAAAPVRRAPWTRARL